LSTGSLLEVI